jgi:hypothetical protein
VGITTNTYATLRHSSAASHIEAAIPKVSPHRRLEGVDKTKGILLARMIE